MKGLAAAVLLSLATVATSPVLSSAFSDTAHIFRMERSKNGNVVQYDVRLDSSGNLVEGDPVSIYWVLTDGRQEDLNVVERRFAYGVEAEERVERDKLRLFVVSVRNREVVVEKAGGTYKAFVSINGKRCVLEKIFVKSEDRRLGLPKVLYVDLYGRTTDGDSMATERLYPN